MAAATRSKSKKTASKSQAPTGLPKIWAESFGVALVGIGLFIGGALISLRFGEGVWMGKMGSSVALGLYAVLGMAGFLLVLGILAMGVKSVLGHRMELRWAEALGFCVATTSACVILSVTFADPGFRLQNHTPGGAIGEILGELGVHSLGSAGTYVAATTLLVLGLVASTPFSARQFGWGTVWLLRETSGALLLAGKWLSSHLAQATTQLFSGSPAAEVENASRATPAKSRDNSEASCDIDEQGEDEVIIPRTRSPKKPSRANRKIASDLESTLIESVGDDAESVDLESDGSFDMSDDADIDLPEPSRRADADAGGGDIAPEIVVSDDEDADEGDVELGQTAAAARKTARPMPTPSRKDDGKKGSGTGMMPVQYLTEHYELPPLELFEAAEKAKVKVDREFVLAQSEQIELTLAHFKIGGKVVKIHPGPVVTRYEFKPEAGVKLSRIETLENDLAMALEAIRIRILAPIPGSSSVGFEVPNKHRETVNVQEILADPGFADNGSAKLPLVLGKNITGKPISIDLGKAPHLLVAGATGSGKSVGVNSMLCSLLYACTPEDLRLILIDPKMLEFSIYGDIPHLLLPVITDAEKANLALRWTVNEMERRYGVLSEAKVRDIAGYNKKMPELQEFWEGERRALEHEAMLAAQDVRDERDEEAVPGRLLAGVSFDENGRQVETIGGLEMPPRPEKMPYIVVVIDEFADLMMVASKEVEANVARIAAKARAAGIHLVVATQRPSVDVITGTIKNNFPSRIAFQVTSDVDSRTILDQKGAKQLLGMGDMLYMDRGKEPVRVHGCFVSEREIEKVVDFVKKQAKPSYNLEITRGEDGDGAGGEEARAMDPLYDKAVQIVSETQKVSTSMIQRRLNVGYNRAAKIVEAMEAEGIIGPARGAQPREVYVGAY